MRELLALTPQALVALGPPHHGRMRAVLRRAFAPSAVEALRPMLVLRLAPSDAGERGAPRWCGAAPT